MSEIENFVGYKEVIDEEFFIYRKSDEYFPIYLVAKKGGDTYEINVNYPLETLNLKDVNVVIEKIDSFKKVKSDTLYIDVQSKIIELVKERQQGKDI